VDHDITNRAGGIIDFFHELFVGNPGNAGPEAIKGPEVIVKDGSDFIYVHVCFLANLLTLRLYSPLRLDISPNLLYSNSVQNWSFAMTIEFTYSRAREQLATLLDRVTKDREVVIIQRRGGEDVAMIAADELASLTETAYLLRSPQNAERILSALASALKNEGKPQNIDNLRRQVGLEDNEA
jgi:antitoxin YefM